MRSACDNLSGCPTNIVFEGSTYIVTVAPLEVSFGDLAFVGTGRGNGIVLADGKIYSMLGVSASDAVVVLGTIRNGTEPSPGAARYFLAVNNRYGNASGPSMWSVPGLCQYLVEPTAECERLRR
jgi:hypothetical protein